MDNSDVRFMAVSSASETHFRALQGTVSVGVDSLIFWGFPGIEHLTLGTGRLFDLTCGVGGADRVYLSGLSVDYRVTVAVANSVMTLTHSTAGTTVRLHMLRGPAFLVFEDGFVGLDALWLRASQSAALLHVLGAARVVGDPTVADHVVVSPQPTVGLLPEGALLQMAGRKGVETVYACAITPAVFLDGVRTDYRANLHGRDEEVLTLGRCKHGLWQIAYVMGPAWLYFSDGFVESSALHHALKIGAAWPPAVGQILPDVPRISAITLDCNVTSHVLDGVDAHVWRAGQVLEINVFLCQAVLVTGAPKLQLRVSGHSRMAVYSGGSGSRTLRFIYWLSTYDAAQLQGREVSVGRAQADGYPNVEAGPLWPCGALIVPLTGHAKRSDDHTLWVSTLDIDLDEIEAVESLDVDLDEFDPHAVPQVITHPTH